MCEIVRRSRQRNFETADVHTALFCIDVVDEAVKIFGITIVILKCDLYDGRTFRTADIDRIFMQYIFIFIQIFYERTDTAFKMERFRTVVAFITQGDLDALIEECQFAQTMFERIEAVVRILEYLGIRLEEYFCSRFICITNDVKRVGCAAARKTDFVDLAVAFYADCHIRAECVYDGYPYTVKTARYLISVTAEFTAGMKDGKYDFNGRFTRCMHINRDTAAVIAYDNTVFFRNNDFYIVAIACQSFVDTVVDDFIYQMVKTAERCRPDIHTGAFAYGFQTFKYLYLIRTVLSVYGRILIGFHFRFPPFLFFCHHCFYTLRSFFQRQRRNN